MRNNETSEYTKTVGIKPENLEWIKKNKGKKSAAGHLDMIINYYKLHETKTSRHLKT